VTGELMDNRVGAKMVGASRNRQGFPTLASLVAVLLLGCLSTSASGAGSSEPAPWDPARGVLIEGGTVVTMDDDHSVIPQGRVLVRNGRIVAVWQGPTPPEAVEIGDASVVRAGPRDLLFPGLINLHNHPRENHLHAWPAPSSHALPAQGKAGTDPYANRYQWGGAGSPTAPPELDRLVGNPANVLAEDLGLGLAGEIVKYAETAALLGGETAIQGAAPNPESDGVLTRNIDNDVFDERIAEPRVGPIASLGGVALANLLARMQGGEIDAWLLHLSEGVREADRRPGDPVSSRAEFATLKAKGLLTDMTVILHGTALERPDFADMRAAPTIRSDGVGDGRGAKLVWSPLSNLLLYGKTANVYEALAEGVLTSLGTDWTPSGSRTLLQELKIADVALRDERVLAGSRELVPAFAPAGKDGLERQLAEAALDRALADMVTRNPALTLRWYDRLGSVEAGKIADLLLLRRPPQRPARGLPPTVYRDLIDATEREVELVLVGGDPIAGDVGLLSALKPSDHEVVASPAGRFEKAVDVTTSASVPEGDETLADFTDELELGLTALGGDNPPAGGGPGPPTNTYSYLKANVAGGQAAGLPDSAFGALLASYVGVLPDGSLNLERIQLAPLFPADDDFLGHLLRAELDPFTGLLADPTPPFALYPSNLNHVGPLGNPFAAVQLAPASAPAG
jgi:5-methylthioadenosine/S-adenosylhomocysteine deaminase